MSYDVLIKTNGGTRTDNGTACGSGAHVGFDSRYGRVVTFRKGTLKPGCEYVAEITALYSSAITGIPAILGEKAAPGKQLSKGHTQHAFSFTKPQRNLVLKVNGEDQEDGAQVDVSEGSKVTLTADVGGAAPDHGLRINLVATGTAGSLAGCSTGTGHDWGPGLNCAGGTETANLHIAAGQNSASIDIKFHQDAQEDPGETLTLTASYVIRGESDSHSVTFNIEDIYHANKLSVQSSSAREKMPEGAPPPAGIDDTKPVRVPGGAAAVDAGDGNGQVRDRRRLRRHRGRRQRSRRQGPPECLDACLREQRSEPGLRIDQRHADLRAGRDQEVHPRRGLRRHDRGQHGSVPHDPVGRRPTP